MNSKKREVCGLLHKQVMGKCLLEAIDSGVWVRVAVIMREVRRLTGKEEPPLADRVEHRLVEELG